MSLLYDKIIKWLILEFSFFGINSMISKELDHSGMAACQHIINAIHIMGFRTKCQYDLYNV